MGLGERMQTKRKRKIKEAPAQICYHPAWIYWVVQDLNKDVGVQEFI